MNWINALFSGVVNFVGMHPFFTMMMAGAYIVAVGQLPAPTATSRQWYKEVFAVLNFFSLQFKRMFPKVENSPNFQDAVNLQQKIAGQEPTTVKVPPAVEDIPAPPAKPTSKD
jgi:hypothetical protein